MNLYRYLLPLSLSGFIFAIDQISKVYIHTTFKVGEFYDIIEGFFRISYVRNPGGIFGLFKESPDFVRYTLLFILPVVAIFVILKLLQETQNKYQITALGFILGGAFGNYFDRVRMGYVVDFLDFYVKEFHWPIFNIADIFIVLGVMILSYFYFLTDTNHE